MKAFSLFLVDVNDGKTHTGLTADLDELLRTVQATGRGGSLTLKVGNGQVKFWHELDRPERAEADAFNAYTEQLRKDSGYLVLLGSPA